MKNPATKLTSPDRHTQTRRAPSQMVTYPTHRRDSRGGRSAGSVLRAVSGAPGAGAAAGGLGGVRASGSRGPRAGARCSPAQGQRRRLLAGVRLSQVAAVGGRGVLRPHSGPLLPPPRAPRGFAPRTRPAGSRRWQPRRAPIRGAPAACCTRVRGGADTQSGPRAPAGRRGGATALAPTPPDLSPCTPKF